jgi:hypothetical protein
MSVLLAGMILAVAAQAATTDTGAETQMTAPATELKIALDGPATQQPDLAQQAASTGTIPQSAVLESDEARPTVPLHYEAAESASAPAEQAAPQRSVLAAFAKPSDLMRQLMKAPATSQLHGTPLTLGEAVRDARNRQEQTARAKAYWDLAAAVGDYYLALLENTELNVLRQSVTAPAKQWETRIKEAQDRVVATEQAARAAQLRLHQSLGRATGGALPLPADAPHCGRYNTEYDVIFAREPNLIARQLSELMPLRYTALRSQAQAVADAEAWRDQMSRQRDPAGDGLELLQSQDLVSLLHRARGAIRSGSGSPRGDDDSHLEQRRRSTVAVVRRRTGFCRRATTPGDGRHSSRSAIGQCAASPRRPADIQRGGRLSRGSTAAAAIAGPRP